jgi:hypothetical protein
MERSFTRCVVVLTKRRVWATVPDRAVHHCNARQSTGFNILGFQVLTAVNIDITVVKCDAV